MEKLTWENVNKELPKMFVNVIVWGVIEKINVIPQAWQARRWSGWSNGWPGISEGKEPSDWIWLTSTDIKIYKVLLWMPFNEPNY